MACASLLWIWIGTSPAFAGGIAFPPAQCAFGHWPDAGWRVAPAPEATPERELLRASHNPREGVALEAWIVRNAVAASGDEEDPQTRALAARGWQVAGVEHSMVGKLPARRARASRRAAGRTFLLDEYWVEAAGHRYILRVTGTALRALQGRDVKRWLASFRITS
jgi:hypothetical protein